MITAPENFFTDEKIAAVLAPLRENFFDLPWVERDFYAAFLMQSFYVQASFGKVLGQVEEPCRRRGGDGQWRDFYEQIRRETGRGDLAFRDVRALGENPDLLPPAPLACALWEVQFHKILEQPSAGLGFILAWEQLSAVRFPELLDLVVTIHGENCSHYVRAMMDSSPYLAEACLQRIRQLPSAEWLAVWINFKQTCHVMQALWWSDLVTSE